MNEELLQKILNEILELKEGQKRIELSQQLLQKEIKVVKEHVVRIDERLYEVEKIKKLFNKDVIDKIS